MAGKSLCAGSYYYYNSFDKVNKNKNTKIGVCTFI